MLFVVSDDKGHGQCCLFCRKIKSKVSVVCFFQMMKTMVGVVSCVS